MGSVRFSASNRYAIRDGRWPLALCAGLIGGASIVLWAAAIAVLDLLLPRFGDVFPWLESLLQVLSRAVP